MFLEICSNWLRLITLCENITLFWGSGPDCVKGLNNLTPRSVALTGREINTSMHVSTSFLLKKNNNTFRSLHSHVFSISLTFIMFIISKILLTEEKFPDFSLTQGFENI